MNKIRIGHHYYDIEVAEGGLEFADEMVNGLCFPDRKEIKISDKLKNESSRNEVLIHEMTHGIFHEASVPDEEEHVERIAKVLHGFFQDNIEVLHVMYAENETEANIQSALNDRN